MADEPVLVLITQDPRATGRAFEAMRIGIGIVAGENEVTFVLSGPWDPLESTCRHASLSIL